MTTKINQVSIPFAEFQSMVGTLIQQRLVAGSLETAARKVPRTFQGVVFVVELELQGDLNVRRLVDGSYVFTQTITEQVTEAPKSFMDEFDAQRATALENGVD